MICLWKETYNCCFPNIKLYNFPLKTHGKKQMTKPEPMACGLQSLTALPLCHTKKLHGEKNECKHHHSV